MTLTLERRAQLVAQQPTHILTDNGLEPLAKPPEPADNTWRFFEMEPHLITGLEWSGMMTAGRIALMVEWGFPSDEVISNNMLVIFPEETRSYLEFWQRQVNTGDCWRTSGFIGRQAAELIRDGYLLAGKARVKDYWGGTIGCRDDIAPGSPGSPAFVQALMGDEYLAWIIAIE